MLKFGSERILKSHKIKPAVLELISLLFVSAESQQAVLCVNSSISDSWIPTVYMGYSYWVVTHVSVTSLWHMVVTVLYLSSVSLTWAMDDTSRVKCLIKDHIKGVMSQHLNINIWLETVMISFTSLVGMKLFHDVNTKQFKQLLLLVLMFCFEHTPPYFPPSLPLSPSSSSRHYIHRHFPAGCVRGDLCSFPQSLVSIINNKSLSLSLSITPSLLLKPSLSLPLHLRLGCIVGSDYDQSMVKERKGRETDREGGVRVLVPCGWGQQWGLITITITCKECEADFSITPPNT